MQAQDRPLRGAQHENGNRPACKILLVADILVGGQQQLEPGLFRCGESCAVAEPVPSHILRPGDAVARQRLTEGEGGPVIEQNTHQ
jgi:hypothetical protein